MTQIVPTPRVRTFVCKHLSELPPVMSEWQQSCKQPKCSHYCQGQCCNPSRPSASAACPFDGKPLPLEDAVPSVGDDGTPEDSRSQT